MFRVILDFPLLINKKPTSPISAYVSGSSEKKALYYVTNSASRKIISAIFLT